MNVLWWKTLLSARRLVLTPTRTCVAHASGENRDGREEALEQTSGHLQVGSCKCGPGARSSCRPRARCQRGLQNADRRPWARLGEIRRVKDKRTRRVTVMGLFTWGVVSLLQTQVVCLNCMTSELIDEKEAGAASGPGKVGAAKKSG